MKVQRRCAIHWKQKSIAQTTHDNTIQKPFGKGKKINDKSPIIMRTNLKPKLFHLKKKEKSWRSILDTDRAFHHVFFVLLAVIPICFSSFIKDSPFSKTRTSPVCSAWRNSPTEPFESTDTWWCGRASCRPVQRRIRSPDTKSCRTSPPRPSWEWGEAVGGAEEAENRGLSGTCRKR